MSVFRVWSYQPRDVVSRIRLGGVTGEVEWPGFFWTHPSLDGLDLSAPADELLVCLDVPVSEVVLVSSELWQTALNLMFLGHGHTFCAGGCGLDEDRTCAAFAEFDRLVAETESRTGRRWRVVVPDAADPDNVDVGFGDRRVAEVVMGSWRCALDVGRSSPEVLFPRIDADWLVGAYSPDSVPEEFFATPPLQSSARIRGGGGPPAASSRRVAGPVLP